MSSLDSWKIPNTLSNLRISIPVEPYIYVINLLVESQFIFTENFYFDLSDQSYLYGIGMTFSLAVFIIQMQILFKVVPQSVAGVVSCVRVPLLLWVCPLAL